MSHRRKAGRKLENVQRLRHLPGDPNLTRESKLSHPGTIFMGLGGLVFVAYVYNIGGTQTLLDDFFRNLDRGIHHYDGAVQSGYMAFLPVLGVVFGAIALYAVLSAAGKGARGVKKERKLRHRNTLSMHQFAELVADKGVGPRVARESYRLLLPHYRNRMRALLTDSITRDLQMSPLMVRDLYSNMLRMTDRQKDVKVGDAHFDTILEMMQAVERCEDRSLTESKRYRREAREAGEHAPAPVSRIRPARDQSLSFIRPARPAPLRAESPALIQTQANADAARSR